MTAHSEVEVVTEDELRRLVIEASERRGGPLTESDVEALYDELKKLRIH